MASVHAQVSHGQFIWVRPNPEVERTGRAGAAGAAAAAEPLAGALWRRAGRGHVRRCAAAANPLCQRLWRPVLAILISDLLKSVG